MATLLACALGAIAYLLMVYPGQRHPGSSRSFQFEMEGDIQALSEALEEAEAIDSALSYAVYHRLVAGDEPLRTGTVLLARNLTPAEVLVRVVATRGPVPMRFTVPEGFTRFDIAARLEEAGVCDAEDFLEASASYPLSNLDLSLKEGQVDGAEGYLFPDTYELREETAADEVVRRLTDNFEARVAALFERYETALSSLHEELGMTAHDVVILASVVEREAARASERPIIAGVFLNRLRSDTFRPRHRLQADPSVSYGCLAEPERAPSCERFDGRRITRAMLEDSANRYNTYRHGELPPGPIANPGVDAIEAVLAPQPHDYLYFVARGDGRHAFAEDLDTHNANVARYLRP